MRGVILVPEPGVWRDDRAPGGLRLLERQLKQLRAVGVGSVVLLVPEGHPVPQLPVQIAAAEICRVPTGARGLLAAVCAAVDDLPDEFVFLSADRLVDLRILRALVEGVGSIVVRRAHGAAVEPIGRSTALDVRRFGRDLASHATTLCLGDIDLYVAELRGNAAPYVLTAHSPEEREIAWRVLLDHAQKRRLDLPGRYFDGPFENFLVRRLAPTAMTPNQVTLLTMALAAVVGILFFHGWLRAGIVLALAVGVLDGVDGKLARLKLATSKLGELEHVGDFFYENLWYLALGRWLQGATGESALWSAALALVTLDLSDSLLYLVVRARTGVMLDELSSFDTAFRQIAGRRNVYVMLFAVGFFSGYPARAFVIALAWAGVTVAVHAVRVGWTLVATGRRARGSPASSSGTATRALVSDR